MSGIDRTEHVVSELSPQTDEPNGETNVAWHRHRLRLAVELSGKKHSIIAEDAGIKASRCRLKMPVSAAAVGLEEPRE